MKQPEATTLAAWEPLPEGEEQYGPDFIRTQGLVKLAENSTRVVVGAGRGMNDGLLLRLECFHRKAVKIMTLDGTEFSAWLSRYLSRGAEVEGEERAPGHSLETIAADAPAVTLVNSICLDAIRRRASDIHIESLCKGMRIRYRIDGILATVRRLDSARFREVAARIKVMAGLNIMERRRPQDGRTTVTLAGTRVDIRVSAVPTAGGEGGESIVLRLFNTTDSLLRLDELGFDEELLSLLSSLLKRPQGMVLITGPTGSGKSTTLNALIRSMTTEELKIITIEDPVEYLLDGVEQIQTNEKIGLSFDALLRRVLRQDPDVILVGEIRDRETAKLAVRAALTGHLVLSTLHTNDAVSAVDRLRDLGVEAYLIAAVLRGVIAQRLVRRLCPACRRPLSSDSGWTHLLRTELDGNESAWEASGCKACGGVGFQGRFALAECFECDREIRRLIASDSESGELRDQLKRRGVRSLRERALRAVVSGATSPAELERAGAL